jgi:hypothetical protein
MQNQTVEDAFQMGLSTGEWMERERIIKAIEDAPPAMDFFGPYISKEKLYAVINGEV